MEKLSLTVTALILLSVAYILSCSAERADHQATLIIQNSKGEHLGTVTNALVDPSGNIAFIVLSIGEKGKAQGKKEIAVPLWAFFIDRENKILILNVDKRELDAMPAFDVSDLNDPAFAEKVYRFFGLMPSWTEEAPGVEM